MSAEDHKATEGALYSLHPSGVPKQLSFEELAKYVIPDAAAEAIYKALRDTARLLEEAKIPFWIDGGTLLGAVRDGAIAPFDYDADLGMMEGHLLRFATEVAPKLRDLGYTVGAEGNIVKIFDPKTESTRQQVNGTTRRSQPCVDIFQWRVQGRKIELADEESRGRWPGCFHWAKHLSPRRFYGFGKLKLPGPAKPVPYLDRMYPRWREEAVVDCGEGIRFAVPICAERRKFTGICS